MEFWDKKAVIFEKGWGFWKDGVFENGQVSWKARGFDVTNMGFWKDGVFKKVQGFWRH